MQRFFDLFRRTNAIRGFDDSSDSSSRRDIRTTLLSILALLILGLVITSWTVKIEFKWAVVLWAIACFTTGSIIGFLFGIPRVLQRDAPLPPTDPAASEEPSTGRIQSYSSQVNTNLEKISDWLTTIFVGLGLVQLAKVPTYINQASTFISAGIGGAEYKFLAGSLIVYFSLLGFLGGYLVTRLFLSRAFSRADQLVSIPITAALRNALREFSVSFHEDGKEDVKVEGAVKAAAQRAAQTPLVTLSSPSDIALWAKANLMLGEYKRSVEAYRIAVRETPDNVRLRVDYAAALYYAGYPASKAANELDRAVAIIRAVPEIDSDLTLKTYRAATFQILYRPGGYEKAIAYGEEYTNDQDNLPSATIYVNLAAAYGQRYKNLKDTAGVPQSALDDTRQKALDSIKAALKLDSGGRWLKRLQELSRKDIEKNPEDDDLEVFAEDPEFKALLGL